MKRHFRWLVPAVVAVAAVAGFFALRQLTADETPVPVAPAFAATSVEGTPVSLADYDGKVVLLDFWATWCPPCVAEVPNLKATYDKYHERGFDIVGISADEDVGLLKDFVQKHDMPWQQIFDMESDNAVQEKFNIEAYPTTFLIDGTTGKILAENLRGEDLAPAVEKALESRGL